LTWDGTYLWNSCGGPNVIYQLTTGGGQVSNFSPGPDPRGNAWDGTYLWNADWTADFTYQFGSATSFDAAYKFINVG